MAKAKPTPEGQTKARVLTACVHGQANDVVLLSTDDAAQAQADGLVDTTPEAVAYAESLTQE